jgi:hypothetical protein
MPFPTAFPAAATAATDLRVMTCAFMSLPGLTGQSSNRRHVLNCEALAYWMPAFAGMTIVEDMRSPCRDVEGARALLNSPLETSPRGGGAPTDAILWCPCPSPDTAGATCAQVARSAVAHAISQRFCRRRAALSLGCCPAQGSHGAPSGSQPRHAFVALKVPGRAVAPRTSRQPAPGGAS